MVARGHTAKTCMGDLPKGAYERAFGHVESRVHGHEVLRFGDSGPIHDSVNIESVSLGVGRKQAAEWTRKYGHLGVRWDKRTGHAIFKDRASKLRVMKALDFHDRDEVRG
jgi:hypothetical protein